MWRLVHGDIVKLGSAGSTTSESLSNLRSIDQLTYGNGTWEVIQRCRNAVKTVLSGVRYTRKADTDAQAPQLSTRDWHWQLRL